MSSKFGIAAILGALSLCVTHAGAAGITTTCWNSGGCQSGNWDSSTFISGSPTELNFAGTIQSTEYPNGTTLPSKASSSIIFTFTGPTSGSYELTGNETAGTLSGGFLDIDTPASGENAVLLALTGSGTITVTLSDGTSLSGSAGVFGFATSDLFNTIDVTTTGSEVTLTDFYYGTSSLTQDGQGNQDPPAPSAEGATAALTLGGLLLLLASGRKLVFRNAF